MAAKTTKDSMAWLKLNVGLFSSEIRGLSAMHVMLYIKLMMLYWASGNTLPPNPIHLHRRLDVSNEAEEIALADLLNEFFPLDSDGNYSHTELDRQLGIIKDDSKKQSDRAKLPRGSRRKELQKVDEMETDEYNF